MTDSPLKYIAFDEEDLWHISARLSGAKMNFSHCTYLAKDKIFVFGGLRGQENPQNKSTEAFPEKPFVAHVRHVHKVQERGVNKTEDLTLLSLIAEPLETGVGIHLLFDKGQILLHTECIDVHCKDL